MQQPSSKKKSSNNPAIARLLVKDAEFTFQNGIEGGSGFLEDAVSLEPLNNPSQELLCLVTPPKASTTQSPTTTKSYHLCLISAESLEDLQNLFEEKTRKRVMELAGKLRWMQGLNNSLSPAYNETLALYNENNALLGKGYIENPLTREIIDPNNPNQCFRTNLQELHQANIVSPVASSQASPTRSTQTPPEVKSRPVATTAGVPAAESNFVNQISQAMKTLGFNLNNLSIEAPSPGNQAQQPMVKFTFATLADAQDFALNFSGIETRSDLTNKTISMAQKDAEKFFGVLQEAVPTVDASAILGRLVGESQSKIALDAASSTAVVASESQYQPVRP